MKRFNLFRAWLARKIYNSSVTIYELSPLDAHVDGTTLILALDSKDTTRESE